MYQWQPSKWLKMAAVGAGLPFLAAGVLQTNSLVQDVSTRALAAAGGPLVQFDGRDATLSGEVASQEALDAAKKAVSDTYGVRLVDVSNVKVAPPPAPMPLMAPTVESITTTEATPTIKGTWPEGAAKTLEVTAGDKTYALGKDAELTSSNGAWTLKPTTALPVGSYDVTAKVSDGAQATAATAAPAKVVIEAPKAEEPVKMVELAKPTVTSIITNNTKPEIKGTYPVEAAKLTVDVGGTSFELGKSPEIMADKAGNWMVMPSAALPEGETKVTAKVEDASGKASAASDATAVTIDTAPPAAAEFSAAAPDAVWPYAITGKWDETAGSKLAIELNKKSYALGTDKELISDGHGAFTFVPADPLAPGKYDLNLTETDAAGNVTTATVKDAVVVPEPAAAAPKAEEAPAPKAEETPAAAPVVLAAPTVEVSSSDSDHPTIKGTWPAGTAKSLTVDVDGVKHKLGTDFDLLSDASGNWKLTPKAPVVNGTYDVVVTVTDGDKQSVTDTTTGELTVKVAPPPPTPPPAAAYDCEATLARIAAVFPIRFDYDKSSLHAPFDLALNQYAALLKDPRCMSVKMQVAGHADDRGSEAYNQKLSENRAKSVIEILTAAGVDGARLNGVGFGKDKPLDPSHTEDARAKNRRAEFTVAK